MKTETKSKKISGKTKTLYRALSSTSKIRLSPGKIGYNGPKSLRAITEQIASDGRNNGLDISVETVNKVIWKFFTRIVQKIKHGDTVTIEGLGTFFPIGKPGKKIIPKDKEEIIQDKKEHRRAWFRLYSRKYYKEKIKFAKLNEYRISKGMKPLKLWEYKTLIKYSHGREKKERIIKPEKAIPINNYTFDVLEGSDDDVIQL